MKKILVASVALAALYGTANAAPVTSPIYLPSAKEVVSDLSIGYGALNFDTVPADASDAIRESANIGVDVLYGVTNNVSVAVGGNFNFLTKDYDQDSTARFSHYYIGVVDRVFSDASNTNKFDVALSVGSASEQTYVDLSVRYGLELSTYNLAFSIGGTYYNDIETQGVSVLEKDPSFYFKLENEFIVSTNFTFGLDLFYNINGDFTRSAVSYDAYNEYGFVIDANYILCNNSYAGVYFGMGFSDFETTVSSDTVGYVVGLKFTSKF